VEGRNLDIRFEAMVTVVTGGGVSETAHARRGEVEIARIR
jgi:hypothetical protein